MQKIVAITGGIGSGKSVLSRILMAWGYDVYDCDCEAKRIMDSDESIKRRIASEIDAGVVSDGVIDRVLLAKIVFNDKAKLSILNSIVHNAVRHQIAEWARQHSEKRIVFVETAILYSSGLYNDVDAEIRVAAPEHVRIQRVIKRNGHSREHIKARIESQKAEGCHKGENYPVYLIENDGEKALLPQIARILRQL